MVNYVKKTNRRNLLLQDSIEELDLASSYETSNNLMRRIISTQLKDISITLTMKITIKKDNSFAINVTINALK